MHQTEVRSHSINNSEDSFHAIIFVVFTWVAHWPGLVVYFPVPLAETAAAR